MKEKRLIRINKKNNEINSKRISIKRDMQKSISKDIFTSNKAITDTAKIAQVMKPISESFLMESARIAQIVNPISESFMRATRVSQIMKPISESFIMAAGVSQFMNTSESFIKAARVSQMMRPIPQFIFNSTSFLNDSINIANINTSKISEVIKPLSSIANFSSELCKVVNKMNKTNIESINAVANAFKLSQLSFETSKIADSVIRLNIDTARISKAVSNPLYDLSSQLSEAVKSVSFINSKLIDHSLVSNLSIMSRVFSNVSSVSINSMLSRLNMQLTYDFSLSNNLTLDKFDIVKLFSDSQDLPKEDILFNADGTVAINGNTYSIKDLRELIKSIIDECRDKSKYIEDFLNNLLIYAYLELNEALKPIIYGIISSLVASIIMLQYMNIQNHEAKPAIDYKQASIEIKLNISNVDGLRQALSSYRFVGVQVLNLRFDGNSKAKIKGKLYFGDVVEVLSIDNNWAYIKIDNEEDKPIYGWIYNPYLRNFGKD